MRIWCVSVVSETLEFKVCGIQMVFRNRICILTMLVFANQMKTASWFHKLVKALVFWSNLVVQTSETVIVTKINVVYTRQLVLASE